MGRHRIDDEPDEPATRWSGRATPIPPRGPAEVTRTDPLRAPDDPTLTMPAEPAGRSERVTTLIAVGGVVTLAVAVLAVVLAVLPRHGDTAPDALSGVDTPTASLYPLVGPDYTPSPTAGPSPTGEPAGTAPAPATNPPPDDTSSAPAIAPSLPAGVDLTAAYSLQDSWPGGFIARVVVDNAAADAQSWQVTIEYPPSVSGYVTGWSNAPSPPATVSTSDSATITDAAPLGPGQSVAVFVQFGSQGQAPDISPTSCAVNGTACTLD